LVNPGIGIINDLGGYGVNDVIFEYGLKTMLGKLASAGSGVFFASRGLLLVATL